ncbi:hypothetical protein [Methyloversatilis discipulorum]|uniref:hypothetical protein n=1 Tax=Methyloversatilis discipulorum TaxID=1119528 RepID=UPI003F2DB32A
MRRVHRPNLPGQIQAYLDRKAHVSVNSANIERRWKSARKTKSLITVLGTLQSMMGPRQRCMYCVDSHGSDIEHFWPKGTYPARAFVWSNMLLCCTECGRFKLDRFPLSTDGLPLLVNPSDEDPWEHLDFDPDTGNLTARYIVDQDAPSAKGEETVKILQLDRREGMAEGYRQTFKRIVARVNAALAEDQIDPQQLADDLLEYDDHGLMGWCFGPVGRHLSPFQQLHDTAPAAWAACEATTA